MDAVSAPRPLPYSEVPALKFFVPVPSGSQDLAQFAGFHVAIPDENLHERLRQGDGSDACCRIVKVEYQKGSRAILWVQETKAISEGDPVVVVDLFMFTPSGFEFRYLGYDEAPLRRPRHRGGRKNRRSSA